MTFTDQNKYLMLINVTTIKSEATYTQNAHERNSNSKYNLINQ
jgi:hypothetical protein